MTLVVGLVATLGACGNDECDPSGQYEISFTRTSGNCIDLPNDTLTVSKVGDEFQMQDSENVIYTGTVELAPDCRLDVSATADLDEGIAGTGRFRLDVDEESGAMTGTLTLNVQDNSGEPPDASCDATYSVSGTRR